MNRLFITLLLMLTMGFAQAQIDTITPATLRINPALWRDTKASYAVFFEDSTGKRLTSADIWDRSLRRTNANREYEFTWSWYRRDSLLAHVSATGQWPLMTPLTYQAVYTNRGKRQYAFHDNVVTIPDSARRTAKDSLFRVVLKPEAFAFPMDLELLPLLPFRKVGQQFAMAFYEPGSPASAYYRLRVVGRESITLPGQTKVACWVLRIEYAAGSYATFWISEQPREVIRMQEYFRGRYRYKVKLY